MALPYLIASLMAVIPPEVGGAYALPHPQRRD